MLDGDTVRADVRNAHAHGNKRERHGKQLLGCHEVFNVHIHERRTQSTACNVWTSASPVEYLILVAEETEQWFHGPW